MDVRKFKVLYIEDNPVDIRYFKEIAKELSDIRLDIVNAGTLSQGKHFLSNEKFDLTVCDLGLPDSMGLYTVKQVISGFPGLPVIVMTSINDEQLGVKAIRMGAQDYLPKGNFDSGLLARAIKYSVERNTYVSNMFSQDRAKLEAVISIFPGALAFLDKDLTIQDCNKEFEIIAGHKQTRSVSLEKLAGKKFLDCARESLSGEACWIDCSVEDFGKSGFAGMMRLVPVMDNNAAVRGLLCVTQDKIKARPLINLYTD